MARGGKVTRSVLRESENKYRALAEMSPIGIFRSDTEGYTAYVNPRWLELAGISEDEALGFGWLKAVHPADRKWVERVWEKATRDFSVFTAEYRYEHSNGRIVWVIGQAVPELGLDGKPVGYVGTITDISDRKAAEAQLLKALADKDSLLKEVNHRVNNTLQVIISLVEMSSEKLKTAESARGFLKTLTGQMRAMAMVYEQLCQTGSLAYIEMNALAVELIKLVNNEVPGGAKLELETDDIKLDLAKAMPCALIIHELILNAAKHAYPSSRGDQRHVCITLQRDGSDCRLSVSDYGCGLSLDFTESIPQTAGLGLVHILVDQLKGSVTVSIGSGTRWDICFPIV